MSILEKLKTLFKASKPIYLDCYTDDASVFKYAPIVRGTKLMPSWWKKLDSTGLSNMRQCVGMMNLYSKSFIIPLWCESHFWFDEFGGINWQFYDYKTEVKVHNYEQRKGWLDENNFAHAKIESPWVIKCSEPINFLWKSVEWEKTDFSKYLILGGCVEFLYQTTSNINLMFKKQDKDEKIIFGLNQPMVHLIPMTERKVNLRVHLVSSEELFKLRAIMPPISKGRYKVLKEHGQNEKKCPFGF